MGGNAFPVFTPRMRPEAYRAIRDLCQKKLRDLFVVVATPIEGPAKADHGDIDVLAVWNRDELFQTPEQATSSPSLKEQKEAAYRALGANLSKSEQPHTISYAVPWPKEVPIEKAVLEVNKPVYIQVDLHICPSLSNLQWMLFRDGHGDMWNLLGSTIRPFGLTVDGYGLYIRIPEIENDDRKKARVLLSSDSEDVLHFLGLKIDKEFWDKPFDSEQDLFEYAATCRLFWVRSNNPDASLDDNHDSEVGDLDVEDNRVLGADMRKINSKVGTRVKQRAVFKRWFKEFLPACRASGRYPSTPPLTRDEVRELAFQHFPAASSTYYSTLKKWRVEKQRISLWKEVIKPAIPAYLESSRRSCCAAALKKIILNDDTSFDGIVAPSDLKDSNGFFDEALVSAWVGKAWSTVLDVSWRKNQERYAASKERKAALKRTGSGEEKSITKNDITKDCKMN
ncbi:hypothetical protein F5Y08DRAFT_316550 [Xylaria arbuscula]|nr:hypothetical protein F5Y08DRAFT_316550 [Xylaria arbuscula]